MSPVLLLLLPGIWVDIVFLLQKKGPYGCPLLEATRFLMMFERETNGSCSHRPPLPACLEVLTDPNCAEKAFAAMPGVEVSASVGPGDFRVQNHLLGGPVGLPGNPDPKRPIFVWFPWLRGKEVVPTSV